MSPLQKEIKYATGIPELDTLNADLIDLIQECQDLLKKGYSSETLDGFMKHLELHTRNKSHLIDKYIKNIDNEILKKHEEEHEYFLINTAKFIGSYNSGELPNLHDIRDFLMDWLTGHVLISDRNIADLLNGNIRHNIL